MTDDSSLTSAGKRIKQREEDLALLGLPHNVEVSIDLRMGLAHFAVGGDLTKKNISGTLADLGPKGSGINIDIDTDNQICAVEDISGQMSETVTGWIKALLKAKRMMDLKKSDPARYQELYGYKTHYGRETEEDGVKVFSAICGETNSYKIAVTNEAWQKALSNSKACQRCQKLI